MAQGVPQLCPSCGIMLQTNQRWCARCGLDMASLPSMPTQSSVPAVSQPGFQPPTTPPTTPPTISPASIPQTSPFTVQGQVAPPQQYQQPPQSFAQSSLPPRADQPTAPQTPAVSAPSQQKRSMGRVMLPLALLSIIVLVVVGYFGAALLGIHIGPTTQPTITSTGINVTATYANVAVTVQKVQQAQSFSDDPDVGSDGAVRLFLLAQNKTEVPVNLPYDSIAHIILPGGKVVAPSYVRANIGVPPGATKQSMLDFAVPFDAKVGQLALRLGGAEDATIDIPLRAGADLTGYVPKMTQLRGTWQYLGLDWSLVSATTQLSIDGKQAARNMYYVTITLKVDNTLAQTAISGSPYDYIRLKAGSATVTASEATLPVSFAAGARGQTGTVTFLIPQNVPALTLIMMPQKQGGFDQASQDFQL
jgi:hypothetical protein